MTEPDLPALQAIIDRSTRTASPAVADSVAYPERQMSAAEFVETPASDPSKRPQRSVKPGSFVVLVVDK